MVERHKLNGQGLGHDAHDRHLLKSDDIRDEDTRYDPVLVPFSLQSGQGMLSASEMAF